MCGIAGIFHTDRIGPVDPARIEGMSNALAHRGPDGSGVWTVNGIGLGHRRLSVIDLEGSPQPMHSHNGRFVIVFNGEIYNFEALRSELEADGARFLTSGDTEVILAAYAKWGAECLSRLDGMFAFAIYDTQARTLFLARDRFGVKPLFHSVLPDGSFAFASELKGLLTLPEMPRKSSPQAIDAYLTWGYVPDSHSILQGVGKLPAGHFMLLEQGKGMTAPHRWWNISFEDRSNGSEQDLAAELEYLMAKAVQSRMVADVPLGAFLSGGVDSSSVVALMSEQSEKAVTTCSIGFDDRGLDETSYADQIAKQFATNHKSQIVNSGDFEGIGKLAAMFDEPFADASALPTWKVCELARKHVTVALSGDGADEAFAGYRRQIFHHLEEQVRSKLPAWLRKPVFGGLGRIWPKADWAPRPLRAKATLLALAETGEAGYARGLAVTTADTRARMYSDHFASDLGGFTGEDEIINLMRTAPARSGLDRAQYADLTFWMPGDILTKVDRTSMAVSLEAREPLLDHRLVEFAARLPENMRVRGMTGKFLLKWSMESKLSHEILYRPKQGFVTPIAAWFRGPLAQQARSIASGSTLCETGWFNPSTLSSLAEDHISGRADNSRVLWQLLMLEKSIESLETVI
ncbi:MAG: XrtA/PEP-CTERM system amidotransferase [Pseudomonadota bacterium]